MFSAEASCAVIFAAARARLSGWVILGCSVGLTVPPLPVWCQDANDSNSRLCCSGFSFFLRPDPDFAADAPVLPGPEPTLEITLGRIAALSKAAVEESCSIFTASWSVMRT
jgi:hypothetical protein